MLVYSGTSGVAPRTNRGEFSAHQYGRPGHEVGFPRWSEKELKDCALSHDALGQSLIRKPDPVSSLEISPANIVTRRQAAWQGMRVEIIQCITQDRIEFRFRAPCHLLLVYEEGVRDGGETTIGDLARSTLRTMQRKLTFVPAALDYHEWHQPIVRSRIICLYFDPSNLPIQSNGHKAPAPLAPRLFFENNMVWQTAVRLAAAVEDGVNERYSEALGLVIAHELLQTHVNRRSPARGGLAVWQQRIVANYIDEHLAESVSLAALAKLVNLSSYYFCRAFKQSFGVPPHRYHTLRRIDRAKIMLANPDRSVTETALSLGFSETSSFSAAFRHTTGTTPTAYRRAAG
jgi:AraC family transcriptional regulator